MKFKIKEIIVLVIYAVAILLVFNNNDEYINNESKNMKKQNINILMINSYQQGHYWEEYILEGLKKELSEYKEYDINLKIEYLDCRSKRSNDYFDSFQELLESKYIDSDMDIIYAVNDEAYEFSKKLQNDKNSIFYEKPMVITGVDQELKKDEDYKSDEVFGYYPYDDTINLLELILDLDKDIDTLNLIVEDSLYTDSVIDTIMGYLDTMSNLYQKNIKIKVIRGDYIEDILSKLKDVDQNMNSVNILAGEFQYKDSNIFVSPQDTVNSIKEINISPIYSNDQTYINAGILGGCIGIGQRHGALAADLIIGKVNDLDLSVDSMIEDPLAEICIDYNSIYEYDIKISDINSSMNVINKKFYQLLLPPNIKMLIIAILIVVTLTFILFITEQIKIMEANKIAKENEKLRRYRENLKSDFIINLSHELRTPINLILNSSRNLQSRISNPYKNDSSGEILKKDIQNGLDVIDTNSFRLLKISNNIIDITKAESGLLNMTFKNNNIVSVVEDGFTACIDFAKKKNISMIFDSIEEEIITSIDEIQIQRVIFNLISNAIKFTEAEGTIYVNISKIKNEILIEVKDNGIGIPKEKINDIFQNFYQVDYSLTRKNEGTGIGLCIVRDIIGIHSGRVEVESEENKGSNFKVYIPIKLLKEEPNKEKIININYDIKTMANIELSDLI